MIPALILVPAVAGLAALLIRADAPRRALLVLVAAAHAALVVASWTRPAAESLGGWLALDPLGHVFLSVTSALFLCASVHAVGYLARESPRARSGDDEILLIPSRPEAVFTSCLLFFLATMTLVATSHHFGILWVAIEATTLSSAPLVHFRRSRRSLEATWKYLLICSVGIALALLGNFFLAVALPGTDGRPPELVLGELLAHAPGANPRWLQAAFVFLLVGYGTKMGLAPLHTWLPDAHSEAPSAASALLSGALLNCAFLGILRAFQVCGAAGHAAFCRELLVAFGLLSLLVSAVFILGQTDFKRMLAYSSVEHVGIMAVGIGLGGAAASGAVLHAVNHSLAKASLFLVAGNILAAYGTKSIAQVRGMVRRIPVTGALWLAGFLAITGSPPFGPFLSELKILKAAVDGGHAAVALAYVALLSVIFVGMASAALAMAQGLPSTGEKPSRWREGPGSVLPPAALCAAVLVLGLYIPPALDRALVAAARLVGGS